MGEDGDTEYWPVREITDEMVEEDDDSNKI